MFQPGDQVIYRMTKHSTQPGPRARDINPADKGDSYSYVVDKFWVVADVLDDGRLILRTRRGKEHCVPPTDPQLRRANWLAKVLHGSRFPTGVTSEEATS